MLNVTIHAKPHIFPSQLILQNFPRFFRLAKPVFRFKSHEKTPRKCNFGKPSIKSGFKKNLREGEQAVIKFLNSQH